MSASFPFALAALVLAVPLVAAYLHRRRRVEKRVPSLLLLRVIAGTSRPTRRAWSRPRHLVSLVLVLLALVGLVLALVDLHDEHDRPRDFVVVFDTSASMGASDGSTRLQHGIEAVDTALGALRPGDRVALVTTGAQTLVRVGLTEDHGRVREVLGTLTPEGGSQGAAAALRIADAICRAGEDGSIVLVSDLVGVDIPATSCPVEHIAVGRDGLQGPWSAPRTFHVLASRRPGEKGDKTPPELVIDDVQAYGNIFIVAGRTEAGAGLRVNGELVAVAPNGTFTKTVLVAKEGWNVLELKAMDNSGNEATVRRRVFVETL